MRSLRLSLLLGSLALGSAVAQEPSVEPPPPADLTEANQLVSAGAYADAEKILAELQPDHPDDTRILLMRGELLLALGRPPEALPLLRRCAELDPELPRVHFQLGTALQATGDLPAALAAFAREIEVNDDSRVRIMARMNRSLLLQHLQDWNGAADELEQVLQLDPTRIDVYGDLASLLLQSGDLARAAEALDRGWAAGFRSAKHLYGLGARYYKDEAYEDAVRTFRKALEADASDADVTHSLALALDKLGRDAEAVQQWRRYLEMRPDAPEAAGIHERLRSASGG